MQPSTHDVPALVDRWVAAGIITPDQAARIKADLATLTPATAPRPVSLVAEGLGYLGGAVVVVGLILVLDLSWGRLLPAGRVGVVGGIALAFLLAGAFVPAARLDAAGRRLRGVLWLGTAVAAFSAIGLFAQEILHWTGEDGSIVVLAGAGTAVISAVLWWFNHHPLQQLSVVVPTAIAAGFGTSLAGSDTFVSELAVWTVGVVWFILSLPNIIPSASGGVLGALTAVTGGVLMLGDDNGKLMALATGVALVATAVARRQLAVLGIGSVGSLIALGVVVNRYFPGTLPVALALIVGGLVLVTIAVLTARRRPAA